MIFFRLLRHLKAATLNLSWPFLGTLVVLHALSSWIFMALAGEVVAETLELWLYFYVVTATTVGYGDYSPETVLGQNVAVFWLIPGSILLFASFLGKSVTLISTKWRAAMHGKGNYADLTGHTLIIGWHGEPTETMVDIILKDKQFSDEIVLCVVKEMENPLPDKVRFVRGESFSSPELLLRAGVRGASQIIIYDFDDERVATIALSVYRFKQEACHVVAHCDDQATASMLREALPGIECTQGLSIEMLVRSAMDRGISRVVNELLALDYGATQFQQSVPALPPNGRVSFGDLMITAKRQADITLLGLCKEGGKGATLLNPAADTEVAEGDVLYYMGAERIPRERLVTLLQQACAAANSGSQRTATAPATNIE